MTLVVPVGRWLTGPFDLIRDFTLFLHRDGSYHRCHKPDHKEFTKVATRMAVGFIIMGFISLFIKLIFIPINNIIVGSG